MLKYLKLLNIRQTQEHPFHVLHSSKLPMFMSFFAGSTALIFIAKLHAIGYADSFGYSFIASQLLAPFFEVGNLTYASIDVLLLCSLICGVIVMGAWSYNLMIEARSGGHHTFRVQLALKYGMLLFLVSEAMLFFPFFWSFFHGALSPSIAIGGV
jgi:heme/copper-type cytochrome/quinol oxidase subunit 3